MISSTSGDNGHNGTFNVKQIKTTVSYSNINKLQMYIVCMYLKFS